MTSNTTGSSIQPGSVATESTASAAAAAGPTLLLTPLRGAVPAEGGTLELLIRVQAPAAPALQQRAPLRLSLVVDRSGSMDGQPLTEALRCVNHIAERLLPTDQLAVVLYDHQIQIPFPLHPANQAAAVAQTLARIDSGGSTDLFGGWQAGARQLEAADPVAISRVLLLSDGQANHGLTDVSQIADHCAQWLTQGVSTSTVGLGQGFNEELMIAMARAGAGQHGRMLQQHRWTSNALVGARIRICGVAQVGLGIAGRLRGGRAGAAGQQHRGKRGGRRFHRGSPTHVRDAEP